MRRFWGCMQGQALRPIHQMRELFSINNAGFLAYKLPILLLSQRFPSLSIDAAQKTCHDLVLLSNEKLRSIFYILMVLLAFDNLKDSLNVVTNAGFNMVASVLDSPHRLYRQLINNNASPAVLHRMTIARSHYSWQFSSI